MKTRSSLVAFFSLFWLLLHITCPASGQTVYENGPINGEELGWTINMGFGVADSFLVTNSNTSVTGFQFGAWLTPGDVLQSAEVSISEFPFSGTYYYDGIVNFTASGCFQNGHSYEVCTETGIFSGPTLNAGTYWLDLQNAVSAEGNPVYWDMNNGVGCHSPGCPSEGSLGEGTVPSEAFTILGSQSNGTTPEPISLVLFSSGILSVVVMLRRKSF